MRATGIVRRLDNLGRVVIPKEIRKHAHLREEDPMELYLGDNGEIILKLYEPMAQPWRQLSQVAEEMRESDEFKKYAAEVEALAKRIMKENNYI